MKRDMALVREILLATEARPPGLGPARFTFPASKSPLGVVEQEPGQPGLLARLLPRAAE